MHALTATSKQAPRSGTFRSAARCRQVAVAARGPCSKLLAKWLRAGGLAAISCRTRVEYESLRADFTLVEAGFLFDDTRSAEDCLSASEDAIVVEVDRGPGATRPRGAGFVLPKDLGRLVMCLRARLGEHHVLPLELIICGSTVINAVSREVSTARGEVDLTAIQFDLLVTLAEVPGEVFSAEELLERLPRLQTGRKDPAIVRYHVARLRARLGKDGDAIQNVRGCGYRMIELGE